ncbi:PucR family transcriptional regulator ligand-binding domain-containing protein [Leucobacter allii]|uniref:PucR family transcriptional regulator n=1 Tax=Leucobacter allii TaxID=2932247 RepID=UPI001FD10A85|nr:PucR family transcriptional regulator [Leucobacter allii]UOR02123.1 PucR family transcriptional regulator ligand-binding domain-containing protein [Leucobacter allii]
MAFTVRSLLDSPSVRTDSLTPGVGESRRITWAHVCERPEPWRWLGPGALVMTTGIGFPESPEAQCAYIAGMQRAGIAAVAIDPEMLAAPITEQALAYATTLGFPVLRTAHEVPYVLLAMTVAEAAQAEREQRVAQTERMYAALGEHAVDAPLDALLDALGAIIGARLAVRASGGGGRPGPVRRSGDASFATVLHAPSSPELHADGANRLDPELLREAAAIVGNALSTRAAARRREWLHGSLLLADLCDESRQGAPSTQLIAAFGLAPPFILAVAQSGDVRAALESAHAVFATAGTPALATVREGQVVLLAESGAVADARLESVAATVERLGASAPFTELAAVPAAFRQARSALIRNHQPGRVLRYEEQATGSLFLPNDVEQLRSIAGQVLGPLQTYDDQRGTALTQTLRVFLEENRSWVRAAERLFVHRQTLIARVSRIEKIIDRDLSSMEDTAECWLAVQAAIGCGDLAPSDTATRADEGGGADGRSADGRAAGG